jgi:predicted naringenin-chalcone synthase
MRVVGELCSPARDFRRLLPHCFRRHGRATSSPTILFTLDRLQRAKAPLPCVALAFGPGLAAEAVLFESAAS